MTERIYYSQEAAKQARRRHTTLAAIAFSLGAGVGAMVALLFAPTSGENIREGLGSTFEDGYDRSRGAVEGAIGEAKKRVS